MKKIELNKNVIVWLAQSKTDAKSNMGYIKNDNYGFIFDATYSKKYFYENMYELNRNGFSTDCLVISHHHDDHWFGVMDQYQIFNKIYCNSKVAEHLKKTKVFVLGEGLKKLGADLDAYVTTKCHTVTDIMLIDWLNKIIFMGDMLLEKRHVLLKFNSLEKWIVVLTQLLQYDLDYFVSGHGGILNKEGVKDYINYLNFMKSISENINNNVYLSVENVKDVLLDSEYATWSHEDNFWSDIKLFFSDNL